MQRPLQTLTAFIARDTIQALRERDTEELPHYEAALEAACSECPPPFGQAWYGTKYRFLASDPAWLASSLIANAEKEGAGARKLWELASRSPDAAIGEAIRLHAVDESRHALLYLAMCDLVFPDALDEGLRTYADSLSPRYATTDVPAAQPESAFELVLDELVQMNIGEIRTRIHQLLMRPVISAHCPSDRQARLAKVLDSLLEDETRHIQYTARLIEAAAAEGHGVLVNDLTLQRMKDFSALTLVEVGEAKFVGE